MATEADIQEPVSLAENDGVNIHLTPREFNQPPETADDLLKQEKKEVSSHVETSVSGSEGNAALKVGGSFFESPTIAKVPGEETCHAVDMPYQAEKEMPENEKQIQKDEKFKAAAEEMETKEDEVISEKKKKAEKDETSCEISDATEISLKMDKIEEPRLRFGEEEIREERISDHNEENTKTIGKETIGLQKYEGDGPKENEDAELTTSKEASIAEASSGHNEETMVHIPELTVHDLETNVEQRTEACLKNENDKTWSTETAVTEEKSGKKTSEGVQEKKEERCSSFLEENKSPDEDEIVENKGSEKEGIEHEAIEETSQTLRESIDIIENEGEASSAIIERVDVTLATDTSRIQEDDVLQVGDKVEETFSHKMKEEKQDTNENKKDMTPIIGESQEKDHVDIPGVTQTEEKCLQKAEETQVSNVVQEKWSKDVKENPQEEGQTEILEKAQGDGSGGENITNEMIPEQKLENLLVNHKEGRENIDEQVTVTETLATESIHDIGHTVIAAEDINEALTASGQSKDEPENEEIKTTLEMASMETEKIASGECPETIACAKEDTSIKNVEEMCLEEVDKTQVSNVVQENWTEDVKENPQEEGQIEIPKKAEADCSEGENVKDEMTREQKLDSMLVNHKEDKEDIDEQLDVTKALAEKSRHIAHPVIVVEDINDALTAPGHSIDEPGNEEIKASLEKASEEIETTASGECSETIACPKEDTSIKNEEESSDRKDKEEKSMDTGAIREIGILKLENLQPKELNEKVEIKEVEIPNKSLHELTATHSLEKKTGQLEDEELSVVSEEPQDQVEEEEKSVKVDAIRDDGTPKIENPQSTQVNEKIEMAEVEIQNKSIDELNETHSLKQERGPVEGKELGEISEFEPQDQVEEEEKSVVIDMIRDDGIPKVENLSPAEVNEKTDVTEVEISNKSIGEFSSTHSMEREILLGEDEELMEVSNSKPQDQVQEANEAGTQEGNHDKHNYSACERTKEVNLELTEPSSETSTAKIEKLEEAGAYDSKEKLEIKDAPTSIEEQNFQAACLPEVVITLEGEKEEAKSIKNEEITGTREVNDVQNIKGNIMHLPSEVTDEETVQSSEQIESEVHISTGEDTIGQIVEGNNNEDISQESVEECAVKNVQNDEKNSDKSVITEIFHENETVKTVDYIANEAEQNDERPNPTLQSSLVDSMQSEHLTSHEVSSAGETVEDASSIQKDEYKENYTAQIEVEEHNEEKDKEDLETIMKTSHNTVGQIVEDNNNEDISQESVEECAVKNIHNDKKNSDKSIIKEVFQETETVKTVDYIANEAKQNDERPNSTLESSLVESTQSKNLTSHAVSSAGETVEDVSSIKKDEYKENYTGQIEVEEHNEEKKEEDLETTFQDNEPRENIKQLLNAISEETEAGVLSKMDNTAEERLEGTQDIERGIRMVTEEEITNESHIKSLSQQSVEQDQIKNFQNDDIGAEKSNTEKFEESKTAGRGKSIAHETNQIEESLPTSMVKEVESLQVEDKNIQVEASLEEKKEDGSSINMNEANASHARLEEDTMNIDVEKSKTDDFYHETNQNDESINSSTSLAKEAESLQGEGKNIPVEASLEEKKETCSSIKMDEVNGNNAQLEELEEQNEELLKSEEDSEQILKKIEPGEKLEQPITVVYAEREAVTWTEMANNTDAEITENPEDNVEGEMPKEEDDTKEYIIDERDIGSLSKECIEQGMLENFHNDEINAEASNQEIFKETPTSKTGESIALGTNENNENCNATHPTAPMKEKESLQSKVENINPTEVLPEDTTEEDESLTKASTDSDNNTESAEAMKNGEKERSQGEENREPELQKNETEEPPESSSNVITAKSETGKISEKANDIIIEKEVEAIQNTEETVQNDNNEEENEDIESKIQKVPTREDLKPEAKTCITNVSVKSEAVEIKPITSEIDVEGKHTSNKTEEELEKEEIEEVNNDTKPACLNEYNKIYITTEAHATRDISPQLAEEETALVNKGEKEEERPKMETQEVLDTQKLVLEEVNVMKDKSKEPAIAIAGEMEVVPEKEMHEITRSSKDEDIGKQIIEEGSATKDNVDVPVRGTDEEDPMRKVKEDESGTMKSKEEIKSFNSEPSEQIASRGYEIENQFNSMKDKEEPNMGLYPVEESEEGMLLKEGKESLVEVVFLESQSKEDTLMKEESHVNDSNNESVMEVTKETSVEGVEFEVEAKRQLESSGSYTKEKGPVSIVAKGNTLDGFDINAPRDDASTLVEKRDHDRPQEADEAEEDIKHDIQNQALIAGSDIQSELIISATFSGKISDDNLMECSKMSTKDSELITSQESKPVDENSSKHPTAHENIEIALISQATEPTHNEVTAAEEVSRLGLVDTGIENTNEEARSYESEDLHQNLELHNEQILSKPEDIEILKTEETGELVDQGEVCNSKTSEDETSKCTESINADRKETIPEEDCAKKSEDKEDDAKDSSKNCSLKKDDSVDKEAVELAEEKELEATQSKNYGIPTEENLESEESSKKLDCTSEVVKRDQSHETILETNLNTVEENIISESVEQSSQESQEHQETEEKAESKLEAEDHIKETQNADETTKAAILTEEVREFSLISTESLKATDSNKQTEKVSSEVQEAKEKEERELGDEDSENTASLSPTIPTKESEEKTKEQNKEGADSGYDKIKATTVVKEVLSDDRMDSKIPSDESKPHAVEVEASQQHIMVPEENPSSLASQLPPDDHESIKQETTTMGNANLDDTEDSGKVSDVVYGFSKRSVEELHTDEIREEIKEASETVDKSHSDETVAGIEVATDQTLQEEITKEHETPSLAMPCKEEEQGITATFENMGEKIEKVGIIKDEMPENSTALETTEDRCLDVEKGEPLDKVKEEIKEVSETALKSKHEVAMEDEGSDDKEEKSEEQHRTESGALLFKEHELEYSANIEKIEESIKEVELLVGGSKTNEEIFLPKEESRDLIVSQLNLELCKDKEESPNEAQREQDGTSLETEEKKESSDSILKSNSRDNEEHKSEISSDKTDTIEKLEEQNKTLSSSLLSKEQEDGTSAKIKSAEENKEREMLEDKSEAINDVFLQKEDPRELEVSQLEFQPDKDAKEESPNEIHDRQDGAIDVTKEAIKEVSESALQPSSEDHAEAAENEIVSDQSLSADKLHEQNQTASSGLLSKEQQHSISTNIDRIEEKEMEVKVLEIAPKETGEGYIKKEETRELKPSQLDLQIDNDMKDDGLELIHEAEYASHGTPDEHLKLQPELGQEIRDAEHPSESGKISESEITGPFEKTSNLKIEVNEESPEPESDVQGHEVFTESEETEIKEKHLEATTLDLMEKENQGEKTTGANQIIHNDVTNEQIMEEDDAKKCEEIINGEDGAKESHQDHEIKGEKNLGDEALTKAKQDETISTEKETVENLQQVAADNILVEEAAKIIYQEREMKDKEIPGDEKLAKEKQNEEISAGKGIIENLHHDVNENILDEEKTEEIHQEHEIKGDEILGDNMLAKEMQSEEQMITEKGTVENLHQVVVNNLSKEAIEEIHQEHKIKVEESQGDNEVTNEQIMEENDAKKCEEITNGEEGAKESCKDHEINGEESLGDDALAKATQDETISTEKETVENHQQAVVNSILVEEATKIIHQEHEMKDEENLGDETKEKQNEEVSVGKGIIENLHQDVVENILGEEETIEIHQEHEIKGEEIVGDKVLAKEMQSEAQISKEKGTVEKLYEAVVDNISSKEATEEIYQEHDIKDEESQGANEVTNEQISTEKETVENLQQATADNILVEEATKMIHQERKIKVEENQRDNEVTNGQIMEENDDKKCEEITNDEDRAKESYQDHEIKGAESLGDEALTTATQDERISTERETVEHEIKVDESQGDNEVTNEQIMEENDDKKCEEITTDEDEAKENHQAHEIKGAESLGDEALTKATQDETISTKGETVENIQQATADNILIEEATKMIHQEHEMKGKEILADDILAKEVISTGKETIENLRQGILDNVLSEEATKVIHQEYEIKGEEILGDKALVEETRSEALCKEIVESNASETLQKHISKEKGIVEKLQEAIVDDISSEAATEEILQEQEIKVEESQEEDKVTNEQILGANEAKNCGKITYIEEGNKESHLDHEIKGEESLGDEALIKATQNELVSTDMEAFENLQQVVTDNILVEDVMKDEEIPRNEILGKEEQNEELRKEIRKTDSRDTIEQQISTKKGTTENLHQGGVENILGHQEHEIKGEEIPGDKVLAKEVEIVKTNASETLQKQINAEKGTVDNLHQAVVDNISSEEATKEINQEHEIKVEKTQRDDEVTNEQREKQIMEENHEETEIIHDEEGAKASHQDHEVRGPGDETLTKGTQDEEISKKKETAEVIQQAIIGNNLVEEAIKMVHQEHEMKDEETLREKTLAKEIQSEVTSPEKGVMENIHQGISDTISSEGAIKEIHQENEIKSEEILADLELPGKMQSEVLWKEITKTDTSETFQKHTNAEKGTTENLQQVAVDNISGEKAIDKIQQERGVKSEENLEDNEVTDKQIMEDNDAKNCEAITYGEGGTKQSHQDHEIRSEESQGYEELTKEIQNEMISTEKGTAKSLQQAVADNNLVKEGTKMICQEHEMTEEGIQGDKILAKETQNEVLCKEIRMTDSSDTTENQINTEKGTIVNLHQGVDENISGEEATKEIHQEHEIKGEDILGDKMLAEVIQSEVLHKEITETDASEMLAKHIITEKGIVENLHQVVVDNISSEEATEEVQQEHEIKGEESPGENILAKEMQKEALHKEIQKTDASETIEKHISTKIVIVENFHQAVQNENAEVHFPDETECRKTENAERKLNIESQGDETISRDCITDATTATEKELDVDTSRIEVAIGLPKASETMKDIHQEEKTSDGTLENQSLREVEPETMVSMGEKDVQQVLKEPVAETIQVTQIGGSQPVYATDVDLELKRVDHGTKDIVDEKDGKAIEEIVPRDSAKLSLFDMMQKSTRERQEARESAEEKEPKARKEELEQTEKAKSDEEEDDEREEQKKDDSGSDAPVIVEASRDIEIKVAHKKSHNILSGVGSKVKHSISKVKKAITGKSSHPKQQSPK
ncbi:titin isoform X8 [Manihot esculenta]|uniref:titin isoform X8 n=1 Tax=Manihot esculenta TaxID=3983 RepID=UPI001CC7C6D7|nr:titin isoform X8 [Manihot esculenta]